MRLNEVIYAVESRKGENSFRLDIPDKKPTKNHVPLLWGAMLGTMEARDPLSKETEYFDYDYCRAAQFARLDRCTDLCKAEVDVSYQGWPR